MKRYVGSMVGLSMAAMVLTGCATAPAVAGAESPEPVSTTTAHATASAPPTLLTTRGSMTVIDAGDGAKLCQFVFSSLPPGCGGTPLPGWDWDAVAGRYEELDGVRWGEFVVVGVWDAATGSLTSGEEGTATTDMAPPGSTGSIELATPCEAPPGGWTTVNADLASAEALDAAAAAADASAGVGTVWIDTVSTPAAGTILNVATTADLATTEAAVRELWGGPLCVTESTRSAAEATAVQGAVMQRLGERAGGASITGTTDPHVEVSVLFDDGRLQEELDEEYGVGTVIVGSIMHPVE